ncbi:CHAT domain-containing protein [Actinoallomurus sp. CA-142502]|uniref:CHAT domain-containing protein n=1 Tax=Actinoallomurus sp. CA-142502 TaxID=3239885 RepID=UPI003D8E2579
MDFDAMCDIRDAWASAEVEQVIEGLLGPGRREALNRLFSFRAGSGDMAKALILAYIAFRDLHADGPEEIAERLLTRRLVFSPDRETLVHSLVEPVTQAARSGGINPTAWWDVGERYELLLELWVGEQSLLHSPEEIRQDLIELWDVHDEPALDAMIKNAYTPYAFLPEDLLDVSPTGRLALITQLGPIRQALEQALEKWPLAYHPICADRTDLIEVARRVHVRRLLGELMARIPMEGDLREAVNQDFRSWDQRLEQFVMSMTGFEVNLISEVDEDSLYRYQALTALSDIIQYDFQITEALPTRDDLASQPHAAPQWIVDHVIAEGARNWHRWVGPYPIWLTTAETALHEALLRNLLKNNDRWEFGFSSDAGIVHLSLFVPDDCEDGDLRLTFSYPLARVEHSWELLHLGAAGYIRLTVLRLTDQGEVTTVGAVAARLPHELRLRVQAEATRALRALVGDDMDALKEAFTNYDPAIISMNAFEVCENAKAEDLLDELISTPPTGVTAQQWSRFQNASRLVAKARAELVEARLDGCETAALTVSLANAIEERQRAREVARGRYQQRAPLDDRLAALAALLPDDQTSFVHLTIVNGALYAVALSRQESHPLVEMYILDVPVRQLHKLGIAWASGNLRDRAELDHRENDGLAILRDIAGGIVTSVPIGTKRLILSPVPPLDQLPLHAVALHPDRGDICVLDHFDEVVYAPTLDLIGHLSEGRRSSGPPVLVSFSGSGVPGFEPLRGPELETLALARLYPDARTITEQAATRDSAMQAVISSRIVNVSGHAFSDSDRWSSGLVLAGASLGKSLLTAGHVLAHPNFGNIRLLTLNACRTAGIASRTSSVQTLRGIDGAFLARGVRSVVSTLWEVYDPCALVFSILLHASVAMGESPSKGYQRAVGYLRNSGWKNLYVSTGETPECFVQDFLDTHRPQWRTELETYGTDHVAIWGAFKITGVAW